MARLLVVDDKDSIRTMLDMRLTAEGHAVEQAENLATADRALSAADFDVVITDLRIGKGGDGLDVLRKVKERQAQTEVIVMTAFGSEDIRERALELGALCYLEKSPRLASEVVPLVKRALEKRELAARGRSLAEDNQLLREQLERRARLGDMVGRSAAMQGVFELVDKVAVARTTVLITGESGVGKELVARAVHAKSPRAQRPFVPVNCGAIPEGLIAGRQGRSLPDGRGRHLVPRRDRRASHAPSSQAPAGNPGAPHPRGRRHGRRGSGRAHRGRHQSRPSRRGARRPLPRGPLLSPERGAGPRAAAPRATRGHPAARRSLPPPLRRRAPAPGAAALARGAAEARRIRLPRQRARAGEPDRARGGALQR